MSRTFIGTTLNRVALGATVASTASLLLLPRTTPNDVTLPLVLVALTALGTFIVAEHPHPTTTARQLVGIGIALAVLAALCPVHGSHDVWSYAIYGRIFGIHHANPYVVPPDAFTHDAFFTRVTPGWRGTPSVYGPLFTLLSALFAVVAGPSPLVARLLFQLATAAAFIAILLLLARAGVRPALLAAVAINPLFIVFVINGGHNDALVALGVLAGALAAANHKPVRSGLLVALAATVKISALLAAVALAVWWWRHRDRRGAVLLFAASAIPTALATMAFGVKAPWEPLRAASRHVNATSTWGLILRITEPNHHTMSGRLGTAPQLVVALVAAAVCLSITRRRSEPSLAVAATLGAYLLATPYIMTWYMAWALPVAVAADSFVLTALLAVDAGVLMVAAQYRTVVHPNVLDHALRIFRLGAPGFALAGSIVLIVAAARRRPPPAAVPTP